MANHTKVKAALLFPIIIFTLLAGGCTDEIRVLQPGDPIPVVFAVFDVRDGEHFVKLTKTFAGEADAWELASDPANLFYPDAEVYLTELPGTRRSLFGLVEGIPREPGLFPELPNQAYRFQGALRGGNYRLTAVIPGQVDPITADFRAIDGFTVITPRAGTKRLYLYDDPLQFSWYKHPEAGLFEISFILSYLEVDKTGGTTNHTLRYNRQLKPEQMEADPVKYSYLYYSDPFFAFLGGHIPRDPQVDYRKPVRLDMEITAADTTLARYLNWSSLEIDDRINPNGNVVGAIGVVASKYTVVFPDMALSPRAQDSLVRGRYTRDLEFVANSDW
ncbi:MAG: hypothetical protein R6V75_07455 [Bacteroidales bacterium]